jgi:bifunctional DNase/RNase
MFSVGEAISIWVEIVEARKKEMALLSTDEPIKLAHMLAAQAS